MTKVVSINKNKEQIGLLTDEKFPLSGHSLHLAIEIRENELVCCLLDKHVSTYVAFEKIALAGKASITETILKNDILSAKVTGVSVAFAANSYVLVPAPFFKKELIKDYLGLQLLNNANEAPCSDYIKNLDSYSLYTANSEVLGVIKKCYPNASFRHTSSIFTEYVLTENKHTEGSKVFITVYKAYFDALVIKSGKLILSNRYYYSATSDFIYHLLWVYEQLGLDNEKTPCVFFGDIETESEIINLSGQYISKVSLGHKNEMEFSNALSILPVHKYRSLFTQYLCV